MVVVIESFIAKRNIQELHGHRKAVLHVRFHRALAIKHLLATASADGTIKIWDTDLKREIRTIQHNQTIIACFFSNLHPHILLIMGIDSTLYGWDLTLDKKHESLQLLYSGDVSLQGNICSVEKTCSDVLLLGLSSGVIVAFRVFGSPQVQKSFHQHSYPVRCISSCSEKSDRQSDYFYSASDDGLICCWKTNDAAPYFMFSLRDKISFKFPMENYRMKCISLHRMLIALSAFCKPILVDISSKGSTFISYKEISVVHHNPIMSMLVLQQSLISIAMDGCIALWDASSLSFQSWILKGLIGFPLSFSLAKYLECPLVIGYSNGSMGFVDSRECYNIQKLPNIQTTKRLNFLHREEAVCDICYIPYSMGCSPNYLAMVTTQGQLVFGKIQFNSPDEDDVLQDKFGFQRICSIFPKRGGKRTSGIKFQLCWTVAYQKEHETSSDNENILSLLPTNEVIVMESDDSGQVLKASLWYLKMNHSTKQLEWQYRTCLLQELNKLFSTQHEALTPVVHQVHSFACSSDGRFVAMACDFQYCFIWDMTKMEVIFSTKIAKLHLLSFPQWRHISQTAQGSFKDEKIPLALSCTDGRVGLLCFEHGFHSTNKNIDPTNSIIWCQVSFKSIVSLFTMEESTVQVGVVLRNGSIQIWLPMKEKTPCKILPGHRELCLKLEWSCIYPSFIVSVGRDKILRLWDIQRWSLS